MALLEARRLTVESGGRGALDVLDLDVESGVIHALRDHGGAVPLIPHRQEVARIADRAPQRGGGRISATGRPASAIARYRARVRMRRDGEACGQVPSRQAVPGLGIEAEEMPEALVARIRVERERPTVRPVHLRAGVLPRSPW